MHKELGSLGYNLVTIDEGWFRWSNVTDRSNWKAQWMDNYGRYFAAPDRFPSSVKGNGFRTVSATLSNRSQVFGVHMIRGIPKLAVSLNTPINGSSYFAADVADTSVSGSDINYGLNMSHPGAQEYLNDLVRYLGDQGVRFIKLDFIYAQYPDSFPEISGWDQAIHASGYPIQLSLSPGNPSVEAFKAVSSLRSVIIARNTPDFWDDWTFLEERFSALAALAPYTSLNQTYTDPDMLPFGRIGGNVSEPAPVPNPLPTCTDAMLHCGHWDISNPICCPRNSRLTDDERQTTFVLWCITKSPLIIGGNMPNLTKNDLALLGNDDLLNMQEISVSPQFLNYQDAKPLQFWTANVDESKSTSLSKFVVVINTGTSPSPATTVPLSALGIDQAGECWGQDLVSGERFPLGKALDLVPLASHASRAFQLSC